MSVEKEECELEQLVSSDDEPKPIDDAQVTPKPPPRTHSNADSRTKTNSVSNKVFQLYYNL